MHELEFDAISVVISGISRKPGHLQDRPWQQPTQAKNVLSEAFQVERIQAEIVYAHFQ